MREARASSSCVFTAVRHRRTRFDRDDLQAIFDSKRDDVSQIIFAFRIVRLHFGQQIGKHTRLSNISSAVNFANL